MVNASSCLYSFSFHRSTYLLVSVKKYLKLVVCNDCAPPTPFLPDSYALGGNACSWFNKVEYIIRNVQMSPLVFKHLCV